MNKNQKRGNWYLLTGLLFGLALGLGYSWFISPVQYIDTNPASLEDSYKDEYRKVIAMAYQANQNLGRAQERAALLDPESPIRVLAAQAQRLIAENQSSAEARALALLAADLQNPPTAAPQESTPSAPDPTSANATQPAVTTIPPTATLDASDAIRTATAPLPTATSTVQVTPSVTVTLPPTTTPRPSSTPIEVQAAPFTLTQREEVCGSGQKPGLLAVQVFDAQEQPLAGVKITVNWENGESTFFTGLAPEINPGYADFLMEPGITYSLQAGEVGDVVEDLTIPSCRGGWSLEFQQDK